MTNKVPLDVICDAGPLIHLDRQQRARDDILTILRHLPDHSTLHIRPSLLQEIIGKLESSAN